MRFNGVIFDMDGTLLDTLEDLAVSMNKVLSRFGYPVHRIQDYRYFLGEGMEMLVRRALPGDNNDEEIIKDCIRAMREEYSRGWRESSKPYSGIPELLDFLEQHDIPRAVLSNKPHDFTVEMAEVLLPRWDFCDIRGESPVTPRKPNPAAALEIAAGMELLPGDVLYLGDSGIDMQTSNKAGMYSVGALWGFRTGEELIGNGAKKLVRRPEEVITVITGNNNGKLNTWME